MGLDACMRQQLACRHDPACHLHSTSMHARNPTLMHIRTDMTPRTTVGGRQRLRLQSNARTSGWAYPTPRGTQRRRWQFKAESCCTKVGLHPAALAAQPYKTSCPHLRGCTRQTAPPCLAGGGSRPEHAGAKHTSRAGPARAQVFPPVAQRRLGPPAAPACLNAGHHGQSVWCA